VQSIGSGAFRQEKAELAGFLSSNGGLISLAAFWFIRIWLAGHTIVVPSYDRCSTGVSAAYELQDGKMGVESRTKRIMNRFRRLRRLRRFRRLRRLRRFRRFG